MFNPLVPDLSNLTDKELVDKLEDLWKRAASMRNYYAVHQQIQSLIGSYTVELEKRRQNPKVDQ
jgi:predicted metal-dependent hydrolase